MQYPSTVVLTTHVTGLWVSRALAEHGVNVAVMPLDSNCLARHSRKIKQSYKVHNGGAETLVKRLLTGEEVPQGSVLIPTGDLALSVLSRNREKLARRYRLSVPPWEATRHLLRKDETRRAARQLDIPVPRNYGPIEQTDVGNLCFPVVLKPNDSDAFQRRFGRKLLVAQSAEQYGKFSAEMQSEGMAGEVQCLIPGPDSLSYNDTAYFDRDGFRVSEFPIHKLRKSPPFFGIGRVVERSLDESINRKMREYTDAFVRLTGWHGPLSAEYKRDPRDDRLLLIEVNGRCSFVQQLAWRCGVNYAWLQYREACGFGLKTPTPAQGQATLIHLHADLLNATMFRRVEQLSLRELARPYSGRRYFAVWSARDPWPFVVEWSRTLRKSFKLITSPNERRKIADRAVKIEESTTETKANEL